jgi:tetratricopeptide (TPR) repeat protein
MIPALYADYLHYRRPEPLSGVLLHNELDLLALAGLAVHLTAALDAGTTPALHPLDELSRGQWLDDLGRSEEALAAYRAALSGGLDGAARRDALWRLANLQRRRGDYAAAAATWSELATAAATLRRPSP